MLPNDWLERGTRQLLHEAARIHWSLLHGLASARESVCRESPAARPAVNVVEIANAIEVVAALPGVGEDEVDVRVDGHCLVISGRRAPDVEFREARFHRFEIPSGPFERRLRLPSDTLFQVHATRWCRGLLSIELRRSSR